MRARSSRSRKPPSRKPLPRAIVIHTLAHAVAALQAAEAAGEAVTLLSPPDFAAYGGAGLFAAIVRGARAKVPAVACEAVLDCGDAPGLAMAALRTGIKTVRFGGTRNVREKIAEIAEARGAMLLTARPRALDLLDATDARAACAAWLARKPRA